MVQSTATVQSLTPDKATKAERGKRSRELSPCYVPVFSFSEIYLINQVYHCYLRFVIKVTFLLDGAEL